MHLPWFEQVLQDVRFSIRGLLRSPGFSIAAIASLALGVGAATSIFSVIHGVILHPFPYAHPETLMSIEVRDPNHKGWWSPYKPDEYLDIVERNRIFSDVIGSTISDVLLTGTAQPERLRGNFVTVNSFHVMGVNPLLGRYILPSDGGPESPAVAVLGYKFWMRRFAGDPHVIGRNLRLNDHVRTVVGVMPPHFMWRGADVYLPVVFERGKLVEGVRYINMVGRLKPGVNAAQADADLHPIIRDIFDREQEFRSRNFRVSLLNFYETYPSSIRSQLWILFSAVSLLLLIACVNVSNLMLARAAARTRELAVRASLGAGRLRIVRQLFTESLTIAAAAAVLGSLFALVALRAVVAIIPPGTIPDEADISLNIPVLLFTIGICAVTAILFGLAPALQVIRIDVSTALKSASRSVSGTLHEGTVRKVLVAAEVSLAMVLLVGASLVLRTLMNLKDMELGYKPDSVLSLQIPLSEKRYATVDERNEFLDRVSAQLQSIPGVREVAINSFVHPFANWGAQVEVPGVTGPEKDAIVSQINANYPSVVHVPLKQGRFFSESEVQAKRRLVVVNQTFVRTFLKTGSALGRFVSFPEMKKAPLSMPDASFEVIGIAADLRNIGLQRDIYPEAYIPYTVTGFLDEYAHPMFLLSAAVPPASLGAVVQQRIRGIDPDQPVMQMQTVRQLLDDDGFAEPRFSVFLFSVFAALGLLLAAIGIYGVINYSISRQMHSLGIRVALGAERRDITGMVFGEMLRLVGSGIAVGLVISLFASRLLKSLLWGVAAWDPVSFIVVVLVLFTVGVCACVRPALRASRVNPMVVLRDE